MTMTQQILSADEISFTLAGPPADVDILMDDVSFVEREPETHNCSEIVNGDAEVRYYYFAFLLYLSIYLSLI